MTLDFSDLTVAELRRRGSVKWTQMPHTSGIPQYGAWIAEMDYGTAPIVEDRLQKALADKTFGYFPSHLVAETKAASAIFLEKYARWQVDASQVTLMPNVLAGLMATLKHLTEPNSKIIVPTPAYMPFLSLPQTQGHQVIQVPSIRGAEGRWELDLAGIREACEAGAELLVLCNPWNPVGRVLDRSELAAVQRTVAPYKVIVFADEIHAPLVLGSRTHTSYASLGPEYAAHTVTAIAASKGWNIAGLMCSQLVITDPELAKRWQPHADAYLRTTAPLGAMATIAAYTEGDSWLAEVRQYLEINLASLKQALAGTDIDLAEVEGTYLTWWDCSALNLSQAPAKLLGKKAGIAVNPGADCGLGYEPWLRFNAAMPHHLMDEAVAAAVATLTQ